MRRTIALALVAGAFLALTIVWIISDRRAAQRIYDVYSSANTSNEGLSLAAGYLGKQRKVEMLTKPLSRVTLEANAVVFRITAGTPIFFDPEDLDPEQYGPPKPRLAPLLAEGEEEFVRRGGRMILASHSGLIDRAHLTHETTKDHTAKKVFPIWPDVRDLDLSQSERHRPFLTLLPRMHALYTHGGYAFIARQRIGSGEVYAIAEPDLFRNDRLKNRNNLALLTALAGTDRPVYFDEMPHGIVSDDGALALLKEWNLGVFLLLLALLAVLIFWRTGQRIGPPEEIERDTRSEAIDLVRSLGTLYREVTSDAAAIALYHETLTRTVAATTGLRGEALHKRVADLTGDLKPPAKHEDISTAEFKRSLDALNEGFLRASRR